MQRPHRGDHQFILVVPAVFNPKAPPAGDAKHDADTSKTAARR